MVVGILFVAGKYLLLILTYVFVIGVFKALMAHAIAGAAESASAVATLPAGPAPAPQLAPPVKPIPQPAAQIHPALIVEKSAQMQAGQRLPLTAMVSLGRGEQNAIILSDQYASTEHLLIFLRGNQRFVRDHSSTNGTFVNGRRVSGDVQITEGDEITVGTTVLRYTERA